MTKQTTIVVIGALRVKYSDTETTQNTNSVTVRPFIIKATDKILKPCDGMSNDVKPDQNLGLICVYTALSGLFIPILGYTW